jgi:elongation factor P--beta-lysine ligase
MQFSQDALLQSARRTAGEADVTELLNANYPTRSFIEAAYISFFNQLPDKLGYEHWEQEAKVCGRKEFLKRLISSAVESDLRKNKGIRVKYNPFTMATLRRVHPSDDVETSVDEVEEGGMVTA